MARGALSPGQRATDLERLRHDAFDLLVIAGGITGAGTALDAATRGLRVGLVEAQDWAAGTSRRSSKLVHGGLCYLQMLDFHLVREALKERAVLLGEVAPHLVRPLPILYPLRRPVVERMYVGVGIALYDALGWSTTRRDAREVHGHHHRRARGRLRGAHRDRVRRAVGDGQLTTATQSLLAIVGFQFIPLFVIVGTILSYFFWKTGRIWTGVFLCSLLVTAMIVTNTALQSPPW